MALGDGRSEDIRSSPPPPSTALRKKTITGRNLDEVLLSGFAGGIAGCVAKTSVAPLDRVKILFQAGHSDYMKYAGSFTGVFKASAQIFRETGIRGLLQGHSATLLRIFPYAAIKFMAYEQCHRILMPTKEAETSMRFFVAGAVSGVMSVLVTYPLELIRVRLAIETRHSPQDARPTFSSMARQIFSERRDSKQSSRRVFNFYRGFSPSLLGMVPYAGVSFLTWGFLRTHIPLTQKKYRTTFDLVTGSMAGACAQTASYPFEVVRRRMQKKGGLRMRETIREIWRLCGWRGFYVGLSVGYVKVVPMTGVSYAVWQAMKRLLGVDDRRKKS